MTFKDAINIDCKIDAEMSKLMCGFYQQLSETENKIIEALQVYPENIRKSMIQFHLITINSKIDGFCDFTKHSMEKALTEYQNKEES